MLSLPCNEEDVTSIVDLWIDVPVCWINSSDNGQAIEMDSHKMLEISQDEFTLVTVCFVASIQLYMN